MLNEIETEVAHNPYAPGNLGRQDKPVMLYDPTVGAFIGPRLRVALIARDLPPQTHAKKADLQVSSVHDALKGKSVRLTTAANIFRAPEFIEKDWGEGSLRADTQLQPQTGSPGLSPTPWKYDIARQDSGVRRRTGP